MSKLLLPSEPHTRVSANGRARCHPWTPRILRPSPVSHPDMIPPELSPRLCSVRHPAPAPAPRWNYILHSGSAPARLRHNCQVISNLESASTSRHNNRSQQYIQPNLNNGTQLSNRRQIIQISNRNFRIICPTYIIQILILQSRNNNEAKRVNHLSLFQYSSICWQNIVSMIFFKDIMII